MSKRTWVVLLIVAVLPSFASGDNRDETGRIKPYYERTWGEPLGPDPAWTRGRGYWDRDYQSGLNPSGYWPYKLPDGYYHSYNPAPNWKGDRDGVLDRQEAFKERMQDRREALKDRRTQQLQKQQGARDRQSRPYQYVR